MDEHPISDYLKGSWTSEVLIDGEWIEYCQCNRGKKPRILLLEEIYIDTSKEVRHNGVVQEPWETAYHFWKK
ncbi:MAG: hypothetical protein HOE61_09950 [Candidatus Marinimicrobia bacterium]|jgi:hypothetical protein|nr:hypothetical protein [Candidatus Neomarinimicrobiota bacterium]MBT5270442.1 hypothetical protein [Candidatus Neomarinimicrobiota bacterium]